MAQVFVSYRKTDRAKVEPIVRLLESDGLSVWWDTSIEPGERWDETIRRELKAASCVVVVWSEGAFLSEWVLAEAQSGHSRGILVPALIERVANEIPVPFNNVQAVDMTRWNPFWSASSQAEPARKLIAAVRAKLKMKPSSAPSPKPTPMPSRWGMGAAAAVVLAAVAFFALRPATAPQTIIVPEHFTLADVQKVWDHIEKSSEINIFENFRHDFGSVSKLYDDLAIGRIEELKRKKAEAEAARLSTATEPPPVAKVNTPEFTLIKPAWTFKVPDLAQPAKPVEIAPAASQPCSFWTVDLFCKGASGCAWSDITHSCYAPLKLQPSRLTLTPPKPAEPAPTKNLECSSQTEKFWCNNMLSCTWSDLTNSCHEALKDQPVFPTLKTEPWFKQPLTVTPPKPAVSCPSIKDELKCDSAPNCSWDFANQSCSFSLNLSTTTSPPTASNTPSSHDCKNGYVWNPEYKNFDDKTGACACPEPKRILFEDGYLVCR